MPFPLAPLLEQERIVAKIEELFTQLEAGTAALRRAQAGLKRYKASVLKAAVEGFIKKRIEDVNEDVDEKLPDGWKRKKIGELTDLTAGYAFKKREYSETGVRLLQIANVSFGKIIWGQEAFLPENYLDEYANLVLRPADLLMALNRPLLGDELKIGIVEEKDLPAILYQRVGRFDFFDNEVQPFFYYYAQSPYFINQLKRSLQGVDQPFINKSKLMEFIILLPPIDEQQEIVAEVERRLSVVAEVETAVKTGLRRTERLRQAILKRAFEGRLA